MTAVMKRLILSIIIALSIATQIFVSVNQSSAADLTAHDTASGAAGDNATLDRISNYSNNLSTAITAIGASEKKLLIDVVTTVSIDVTVPSNVQLWFIKGGLCSISSAKILTIYSPANIVAQPGQQIFSGSGKVTFTRNGTRNDVVYPSWWGAVADGATEDTTPLLAALDTGCDVELLSQHTYYSDTLHLHDNQVFDMNNAVLKFITHATTHHPFVEIGTVKSAITKSIIKNGTIDGNKTFQTGAGDEWSPGILIWGSDYNNVQNMVIHDCKGDGVWIGYYTGRKVGSNGNIIEGCEIYNNSRQAVALCWGNENKIINNKISGKIDLEIDVVMEELKNNIVAYNRGRTQAGNTSAPGISDLRISLATIVPDKSRYSGNIIDSNSMFFIDFQYSKGSIIKNNVIKGSNSRQKFLLDMAATDDTIISDNILIANEAVASSLVSIIRTRACSNLTVTNNQIINGTILFHSRIATFSKEPSATNQIFFNNHCTGRGYCGFK
jgi:parallel beta-helix repeat protein